MPALDSGERQYPRPGNQREGSPYKLQRGGFVLRHPAAEGNTHAGRQQQATEMRKTGRDCEPVIQSKCGEQGYGGLQQAKFRDQPSHGPQCERQDTKQNEIDDRRNPDDRFGDVQSRPPPRPIDSLEKQQAHALHQAGDDRKPDGKKQKRPKARG